MTAQDILTLANAGFTAQQISALNALTQQTQVSQVTQPTQLPQATQPTQQVQRVATPQQTGQPMSQLDIMAQQIQQLTGAIQTSNILSDNQPQLPTADDVLAEIINPPTNNQTGGNK